MERKIERPITQSKNDCDSCLSIRNDTCPNLDCSVKQAKFIAMDVTQSICSIK